eukprot:1148048-Pelagomonas_calceolata.AAC.7
METSELCLQQVARNKLLKFQFKPCYSYCCIRVFCLCYARVYPESLHKEALCFVAHDGMSAAENGMQWNETG